MPRALILICLFLCLALAQAQANDSSESNETPENGDTPETPAILALEFRTYELGWIRFRNVDADGKPKLSGRRRHQIPLPAREQRDDPSAPGRPRCRDIAALIDTHEIAWDEDAIDRPVRPK